MLAVAQDVVFHRCGQIPSKLVHSSSSPAAQNTWETMSHVCTYVQVEPITCSCGSVLFTLQTHWESVLHLLLLLGRLWPLCSPPSGRANAGHPVMLCCGTALLHLCPPLPSLPRAWGSSCPSSCSPTTPVPPFPLPTVSTAAFTLCCGPKGHPVSFRPFFPPLVPCLSGLHATEIQTGSCFKTLWNSKMVVSRDLAAKNTAHLRKWDPICKFRHVQLQGTLGCFLIFAHTCLESRPLKNSYVGVWSCWHTQRDASRSLTARKCCPCQGGLKHWPGWNKGVTVETTKVASPSACSSCLQGDGTESMLHVSKR